MKNYKSRIVILAPLRTIAEMARKKIDYLGLKIDVIYVSDINVEEVTHRCIDEGKEIIISRGGIANRIREISSASVINIEINGYDIVSILSRYINSNKKIAIVEIPRILKKSKRMADYLNIEIVDYVVKEIKDYEIQTDMALSDGAEVIISGAWATHFKKRTDRLKAKGVDYEVLESGEIAVEDAIEKAINLYEMTYAERSKKEELQVILNSMSEGAISVDSNRLIQMINPAALRILNRPQNEIIGKRLEDIEVRNIIERLDKSDKKIGKIGMIGNVDVVFNSIPILIYGENNGYVISFQEIKKLQEIEQNVRYKLSKKGSTAKKTFDDIVGVSDEIKRIVSLAKKYSVVDSTVMITGESGSGKEVFAQSIHNKSNRRSKPFVAVNCAALPPNLLESELFGYVEGAFTGARKSGKTGLFELAHTGTLFLDEIGEMDLVLQTRLLRAIQEKEIMRIGDDRIIPVNVRIIAATNKNLLDEVEKNSFREDLYYRINVLQVEVPSLRNRKEDILLLAENYINKLCRKNNYQNVIISKEIEMLLGNYCWPGNIRELQNVMERFVVFAQDDCVSDSEKEKFIEQNLSGKACRMDYDYGVDLSKPLEEIELSIIHKVLDEEKYNKTKAAKRLGIDRTTINRKIEIKK